MFPENWWFGPRPGVGRERPYLGVSALKVFAEVSADAQWPMGACHTWWTPALDPLWPGRMQNVSAKASKDSGNTTRKRSTPTQCHITDTPFFCYTGEEREGGGILKKIQMALIGKVNSHFVNRCRMGKTELLQLNLTYFSSLMELEFQQQEMNNSKKLNL